MLHELIKNSTEANDSSYLALRSIHDRGVSYNLFIKGEVGSEFEISCDHHDEGWLRKIVKRLENPKRVPSRSRKNLGYADDFFAEVDEGYREEWDWGLIAVPGRGIKGGLRLYALEWNMKTFVWLRMLDKGEWEGKWQDHPDDKFRSQLWRYVSILLAVQKQIDFGTLVLNEEQGGLHHYDKSFPQQIIPISEYL